MRERDRRKIKLVLHEKSAEGAERWVVEKERCFYFAFCLAARARGLNKNAMPVTASVVIPISINSDLILGCGNGPGTRKPKTTTP